MERSLFPVVNHDRHPGEHATDELLDAHDVRQLEGACHDRRVRRVAAVFRDDPQDATVPSPFTARECSEPAPIPIAPPKPGGTAD